MTRKGFVSLAAGLFTIAAGSAACAGVGDYNNPALYPAQVSAMHFDNTMDANSPVIWQDWMVGFLKGPPTAHWAAGNGYTTVTIGTLFCVKKEGDDNGHECQFQIQYSNDGGTPICSVSDTDGTYVVQLDSVNCPTSIDFTP